MIKLKCINAAMLAFRISQGIPQCILAFDLWKFKTFSHFISCHQLKVKTISLTEAFSYRLMLERLHTFFSRLSKLSDVARASEALCSKFKTILIKKLLNMVTSALFLKLIYHSKSTKPCSEVSHKSILPTLRVIWTPMGGWLNFCSVV